VSQIQALDRTQPGLPMKKRRAGTITHDYQRNGTTTLFAPAPSGVSSPYVFSRETLEISLLYFQEGKSRKSSQSTN
jgi:hypothetical protein